MNGHPKYPTPEYFKRRFSIANSLVGLEMCRDYPSYRWALEILCGGTDYTYPIRRTFARRVSDGIHAGLAEFRRTHGTVPVKAP